MMKKTHTLFQYSVPFTSSETLEDAILQFDMFINSLDNNNMITNENFLNAVKKVFFNFSKFTTDILSNMKSVMLKDYSKLKKTELQHWYDENKSSINYIKKINFEDVKDIVVPIPTGMKTTYKTTLQLIGSALLIYDIEPKINITLEILTTILNILDTDKPNKNIDNLLKNTKISFNKKQIEKIHTDVLNVFNGKTNSKLFKELFKDMDDFHNNSDTILEAVKFFYNVETIEDKLNTISDTTESIIDKLVNKKDTDEQIINLTTEDIENVSHIIKNLAISFNYLGMELLRLSSLEHNYVLILDLLKSENK